MTITLGIDKLSVAAVCSIITITAAGSANAITVTLGEPGQLTSTVPGATTVDFESVDSESGLPETENAIYSTFFGEGELITGDGPNYSKPYGLPDNQRYLRVGRPSFTEIRFAKPLTYFGLYIGSPEPSNTVLLANLKGDDVEVVFDFNGQSLLGEGADTEAKTNRYVNFFAEGKETFNAVGLLNSSFEENEESIVAQAPVGNSFESANHAYKVVPEPSSALGMLALGAFGAGWMLKRKLKQKALT